MHLLVNASGHADDEGPNLYPFDYQAEVVSLLLLCHLCTRYLWIVIYDAGEKLGENRTVDHGRPQCRPSELALVTWLYDLFLRWKDDDRLVRRVQKG